MGSWQSLPLHYNLVVVLVLLLMLYCEIYSHHLLLSVLICGFLTGILHDEVFMCPCHASLCPSMFRVPCAAGLTPWMCLQPSFVFIGDKFDNVPALKLAKNIFLDFFRGRVVKQLNLMGLDRVIVVMAASDDDVVFVHCQIIFKKSGSKVCRCKETAFTSMFSCPLADCLSSSLFPNISSLELWLKKTL